MLSISLTAAAGGKKTAAPNQTWVPGGPAVVSPDGGFRRVSFRSDAKETAILQEHGGLEREAFAQKHPLTLPPTRRPRRTGSER